MTDELQLPAHGTETWIWERIAAGKVADLNQRDQESRPAASDLDPRTEDGWEERRVRSEFLRAILSEKSFVEAPLFIGVRIRGALVDDETLELGHARLTRPLRLENCRLLVAIKAAQLRIDGGLSLKGSLCAQLVDLSGSDVSGSLDMSGSTFDLPVNLGNTKVAGSILLNESASFAADLHCARASVGSILDMRGSYFGGPVFLSQMSVAGSAYLSDSALFRCYLNMVNATFGADLHMSGSSFEGTVDLKAKVEGSAFLDSALLNSAERKKTAGTTFRSELHMLGASIGSTLDMSGTTFEGPVTLSHATVGGHLRMIGSTCGRVVLNEMKIGGSAFLSGTILTDGSNQIIETVFAGGIELGFATIGSDLEMTGVTCGGKLEMTGAKVAGSAVLSATDDRRQRSTYSAGIDMKYASIGSNLVMPGVNCVGSLGMSDVQVSGSVFLCAGRDENFHGHPANFRAGIDMRNTSVGSDLSIRSANCAGALVMDRATVTGNIYLPGAIIDGLSAKGAKFRSSLDLAGATCGTVDLTGAEITGELLIGTSAEAHAKWKNGAALVLRNASCGVLQDWWQSRDENSWPATIDLEGFTYRRLGSAPKHSPQDSMLARPSKSCSDLLARSATSSPNSYEFLARAFREAGRPDKANDLLYASRERQRQDLLDPQLDETGFGRLQRLRMQLARRLRWFGTSLLKWTTGYGLGVRYFRVLFWVGGLSLLGAVLLGLFGTQAKTPWLSLFFASLDELLPVISLDKAHEAIIAGAAAPTSAPTSASASAGASGTAATAVKVLPQPSWLTVYFFFHKIAGWILGSFLVAGLAGLTQRS